MRENSKGKDGAARYSLMDRTLVVIQCVVLWEYSSINEHRIGVSTNPFNPSVKSPGSTLKADRSTPDSSCNTFCFF